MIKDVCCIFLFLLFYSLSSKAQNRIEFILTSNASDSSFYDICKINDNEFWIGGEHGILKSMDSSGMLKSIQYDNNGKSIYRMLKTGNSLYFAADKGTLYKFNLISKQLQKLVAFDKYKDYCFYDMAMLENGKLLVCGGKSKIVKTKITIPCGFILSVDTSFSDKPTLLWKSSLNFVWSLALKNDEIYASAYNGRISKILVADKTSLKFKKKLKMKALVHDIVVLQDNIWALGSQTFHFQKDGVIENLNQGTAGYEKISGQGCVWTAFSIDNTIYAITNSGCIYKYFQESWIKTDLKLPGTFYCSSTFNKEMILVAGNGKKIALIKK